MKVLVVGEFCYDIFIYGTTKRLSPEAPVPVFIPVRRTENSGMAGNVLKNVKSLTVGATVNLIRQDCVITKTRYVEDKSNHMFMRIDEGEDRIKPINMLDKTFSGYDIVIVSDYNKGFLADPDLLQIGKACTGISILDSKRKLTQKIVDAFNFIKVNEHEYHNNCTILTMNSQKVLITLGKEGVSYMDEIIPSPSPKETIDVSGAGDTFTASFAVRYFETKDIKLSIRFANEMSAIVVSKRGVVTPN